MQPSFAVGVNPHDSLSLFDSSSSIITIFCSKYHSPYLSRRSHPCPHHGIRASNHCCYSHWQ
jgi:hypothetical protein